MSELSIRRVVVVGAGTTGGALAAYLTNVGLSVSLVDVTTAAAATALEHVRSSLYVPERAGEIRTLGIEDCLPYVEEADWIVEAVPERLDAKRAIYRFIAPYVRPDAVVSTASGSLSIDDLVTDLPEGFASRFLAAYFALPLAEHRLVEIRSGHDPALARDFGRFLADTVARRVVHLQEGPGLVARYGYWCLLLALHVAEKLRLDLEDVEAITRLNQKDSGVYGAVDRVGLTELHDAAAIMRERLSSDRGVRFLSMPSSVVGLLARGWTGDRAGRGYTRREGKERLALDFTTMVYRQMRDTRLPGLLSGIGQADVERIRKGFATRDEVGEYLREFLLTALRYAEYLRDAAGVRVVDLDRTMEWGFGWEKGPFRLLDALGAGANRYYEGEAALAANGAYEKVEDDEVCPRMEECPVVDQGDGYTIHDLDDGIEAVALHSGTLTPKRVQALLTLLGGRQIERFVLTSEGADFPELDLRFVLESLRGDVAALDAYLASLQSLGETIAARSCVAAIRGRCVGPSLGLALSASTIVANAESEIGFNEGRLGIAPTARGTALLRAIHGESSRKIGEIVVTLSEGTVATNADGARTMGLIRQTDVTEHLPERLMATAKALALTVSPMAQIVFLPVEPVLVGLIDRSLTDRRQRGGLSEHDVLVGQRLRQIFARTDDYASCLERERRESLDLGQKALSLARIRHVLGTGKTLRN